MDFSKDHIIKARDIAIELADTISTDFHLSYTFIMCSAHFSEDRTVDDEWIDRLRQVLETACETLQRAEALLTPDYLTEIELARHQNFLSHEVGFGGVQAPSYHFLSTRLAVSLSILSNYRDDDMQLVVNLLRDVRELHKENIENSSSIRNGISQECTLMLEKLNQEKHFEHFQATQKRKTASQEETKNETQKKTQK